MEAGDLRARALEAIRKVEWNPGFGEQRIYQMIENRPDWHVVAPVRLQTVCVRHIPPTLAGDAEAISAHNLEWVRDLNLSGEAFLSPSQLEDGWMARVSIGVESTEREHLERLLQLMDQHANAS